ncbi:Helix-turn-helix domain-containing protein [Desulfonatronum thiosulfatophilum]|uniref:Helix-turn-helix domain-containing protein n=1 Tax=Desulfonatronum thiosulfatophilum TaxID=617002 RepID=A0A1G6BJ65_9BACT|nr:helix-turn-helix domain-containing protein [Desulfonatronum thiosulfatophilum]SDB20655.1 Helix-turn-helix domain-containing protein [Desulfonatronum thiosulfatophilum]
MDMNELGKMLQSERLRQGLELADVTTATRINSSALKAIEEADEAALPHPVYLKSFVRNYANFLGLDTAPLEDVLREFNAESDLTKWSPVEQVPTGRSFPFLGSSVAVAVLITFIGGGIWLFQKDYFDLTGLTAQKNPPAAQKTSPWDALPEESTAKLLGPLDQPEQILDISFNNLETAPEAASGVQFKLEDGQTVEVASLQEQSEERIAVLQDLDLRKAALGNVQLSVAEGGFLASFDLSNLTNDILSGKISINFISKDDETYWALGNEEIPQFRIRNFRNINTRLHLPSGLDKNDLAATQIVVTDSHGENIIVKSFPMKNV